MSWISAFFTCWFCILYFFLFVEFLCLAYLIVSDATRNKILTRLNQKSTFFKKVIALGLLMFSLFFLYATYESVVFNHYISIEKM